MFLASVKNLEESFNIQVFKSSSMEPKSLNLSLCVLKIKFHHSHNKTYSTNGPAQKKIAAFLIQENAADFWK